MPTSPLPLSTAPDVFVAHTQLVDPLLSSRLSHVLSANRVSSQQDDANDHIDSDDPRSGVATPQPDPADKRLPGIMHSYFGQVGSSSSTTTSSSNVAQSGDSALQGEISDMLSLQMPAPRSDTLLSVAPESLDATADYNVDSEAQLSIFHEKMDLSQLAEENEPLHPYPTPPDSQPPSLRNLNLNDSSHESDGTTIVEEGLNPDPSHLRSISGSIPLKAQQGTLMNPPLSSVVTRSSVHAAHLSRPSSRQPSVSRCTPVDIRLVVDDFESSIESLKKLTGESNKSTPPTPTRALSNQTLKSDGSGGSDPKENSSRLSPNDAKHPGAPVSTLKGKLTVKILEARGLRKSWDPYVVAVFQRNELVSKGPREEEGDENEEVTSNPMSRQSSDTGRPMAIPMKSRQSSNVSIVISEAPTFRPKGRRSMTNPKWDTEAVL